MKDPFDKPEPELTDAEREYIAERERAQYAKIGMSMDRALGRRPPDLPGRRLARRVLGDEFTRAESEYDVLRR